MPCTLRPDRFSPTRSRRYLEWNGQVGCHFHRAANKLARMAIVRIFGVVDPEGERVGYPKKGHAIHNADVPDMFVRDRPDHCTIVVAYIPMIDGDPRTQDQGHDRTLLDSALRDCALVAKAIGIPPGVARRAASNGCNVGSAAAGNFYHPPPHPLYLPLQAVET